MIEMGRIKEYFRKQWERDGPKWKEAYWRAKVKNLFSKKEVT